MDRRVVPQLLSSAVLPVFPCLPVLQSSHLLVFGTGGCSLPLWSTLLLHLLYALESAFCTPRQPGFWLRSANARSWQGLEGGREGRGQDTYFPGELRCLHLCLTHRSAVTTPSWLFCGSWLKVASPLKTNSPLPHPPAPNSHFSSFYGFG